jgi:hypothetical protein
MLASVPLNYFNLVGPKSRVNCGLWERDEKKNPKWLAEYVLGSWVNIILSVFLAADSWNTTVNQKKKKKKTVWHTTGFASCF